MNTPVSFELAKLLKEKGFNESTKANWWILAKDHSENYKKGLPVDETKIFFTRNSQELSFKTQIDEEREHNVYHVLGVPTIAEVVMWLYEKHRIWIQPMLHRRNPNDFIGGIYYGELESYFTQSFNSPTEAYEAAIEYTLKNLIP